MRFGPGFVERVERITVRLNAARERSEGAGAGSLGGDGEEFVGYRAYRPGEDLRALDWNLYARLDRPYVRVTRREAAEIWAIAFDTSASMGTGPPGKLQRAAELVCALTCLGWKRRARVVVSPSGTGTEPPWVGRGPRDLSRLTRFLEGQVAQGERGLCEHSQTWTLPSGVGRLFLIGDFLDGGPNDLRLELRRGCAAHLLQLLAPHELNPPADTLVEWLDPEQTGQVRTDLKRDVCERYRQSLALELEAWGQLARRQRAHYGVWSTERTFEDILYAALEPTE